MDIGSVFYLWVCWCKIYEFVFNSKNKFMVCCFLIVKLEVILIVLLKGLFFELIDM